MPPCGIAFRLAHGQRQGQRVRDCDPIQSAAILTETLGYEVDLFPTSCLPTATRTALAFRSSANIIAVIPSHLILADELESIESLERRSPEPPLFTK